MLSVTKRLLNPVLVGSEFLRHKAHSWTFVWTILSVNLMFHVIWVFCIFHQVKSGKELIGILFNDFLLLAQPQRPIGNITSIFTMDMKANVHLKMYRNVSLHYICLHFSHPFVCMYHVFANRAPVECGCGYHFSWMGDPVEWVIQLNGVVHIENTDIRKAMVPVTLPSGIWILAHRFLCLD